MKLVTLLGALVGLLLLGFLLLHFGAGDVLAGVAAAGWGVVWVSLYRAVPLLAHGMGWRRLFPANRAPGFWMWFRARWAGEAINSLLPVAQLGGDVARAHMVTLATQSGPLAGATVAVDFTLGLLAQLAFTMTGAGLLALTVGTGRGAATFAAGLLMAACALVGLWLAQKSNWLGRIAEKFAEGRADGWGAMASSVADWNRETAAIYADHRRVSACFVWRMAGWLLMAVETWLILHFVAHPVSWGQALILESLSMAVRAAAFMLPGGLGAQEASLVLLGPMVGISAETALALALVKRLREIIVGVSGLWVWVASEGKRISSLLGSGE